MTRWPLALRAWGALAALAGPLAALWVGRKLARAGVPPGRRAERRGRATLPRPAGALIWLHGASVGETLSVLPLVTRLLAAGHPCLVTAGTATAAQILAHRLPPGALHQFAPLDSPVYVQRFLAHWHPALAVMVESELWPVTLRALDRRAIPRVLLNARMSDRSLARWAGRPALVAAVLGGFVMIIAQTAQTRDRLAAMGLDPARLSVGGNMKAAAGLPPADPAEVARLAALLADRPRWLALSTHPGEEEAALTAHRALLARRPDALLILCPRHPERGDTIAAQIVTQTAAQGLTLTRRSRGEGPQAQVWLADTLGETGLWLRLAPVVFLGGTLVPVGGHNPWEPAAAGAALIVGPNRPAVAADLAALEQAGAALTVTDGPHLAEVLTALMADPARAARMGTAARALAQQQTDLTASIATALIARIVT